MTEPNQPPPTPTPSQPHWINRGFLVILSAQLALLWLQGMQLNRQHHDLSGIREDLQSLAETLDQNSNGAPQDNEGYAPARFHRRGHSAYVRVKHQEEKQEPKGDGDGSVEKELKSSKESAEKAVKDARKIKSQLSISENARIAEEKSKIKEAHAAWEMWSLAAGALVVGALLLRGWLRSRQE